MTVLNKIIKIVDTICPSYDNNQLIEELVKSGMDVARINCSHADHQFIETTVAHVRQVSAQMDRAVGILLDLSGPKLRTRGLTGKRIDIKPGEMLTLTSRDVEGSRGVASTNYDLLAKDVKAGDKILLDDGLIE